MLLPDLSEYQPNANMAGIKSQNGGAAIIRAMYGVSHIDTSFVSHRGEAAKANFKFLGIYHYLVASEDAVQQAEAFCRSVGELRVGEIPILDIEEGTNYSARANAWLAYVDSKYALTSLPLNRRSWIYSNADLAKSAGLEPIFKSDRHSWVAAYTTTEPVIPHTLWQCTDGKFGAHITTWPGAGRCDTNFTRHTLVDIAAMAHTITPVESPTELFQTVRGRVVNFGWADMENVTRYRIQLFHYNNGKQGDVVVSKNVVDNHLQNVLLPSGGGYMWHVQAAGGPWSAWKYF